MPSAVLSSSPRGQRPRLFMRAVRFVLIAFGSLIAALFIAWAAGALYFDLPAPSLVRTIASLVWAVGAVVLAAFGRLRGRILVLLGFAGITCWWLTCVQLKMPIGSRKLRHSLMLVVVETGLRFTI